MKKVLFGGSFNPPTLAHFEVINYLANREDIDEVIILPNGDSYNYNNKSLASFNDRVNMLKLELKSSKITISDIYLHSKFNGIIEVLDKLDHPTFVMGDDCLTDIFNWIKPVDLIKDNNFIVFSRTKSINDMKDIILGNDVLSFYKDHFELVNIQTSNVSSSQLRNNLDLSQTTKNIQEYIKNNHLYGF